MIFPGKSSLKKTVYGECYDPIYIPTLGIDADPSITRITFKQYKEWILQNASKADASRLNLEYIDIIIDYVLKALQQPQISDDTFDVATLHIEKDRVHKVDFNPSETFIPKGTAFEPSGSESEEDEWDDDEREGLCNLEEDHEIVDEERNEEEDKSTPTSLGFVVEPTLAGSSGVESCDERLSKGINQEDETQQVETSGSVRRITKVDQTSSSSSAIPHTSSSSVHSGNMSDEVPSELSQPSGSAGISKPSSPKCSTNFSSESSSAAPLTSLRRTSIADKIVTPREFRTDSFVFQAKGELSRLLVENIPREILKRMVIRWPVGDTQVVSRAELNKKRLMITVWDVAGDPLQQNFIPFFFSHRCLFVSMYNMTRGLDSPCESFASKNLCDPDSHIPTNAEVLEDWLGYVNAFSKPMPSIPFRCNDATPVLPPLILACSFADKDEARENPVNFNDFFRRKSFKSYCKHLVEANNPSPLIISSKFENEGEEMYAGHHLLRREIDHLARQMPFCSDSIPIQWVKFEQLIYGLKEQKKIILLYNDLTRYVSEHCNVSGTLQILPMFSHFHDVGVIMYFYRHPLLSNLIITKPQWLADALSSVVVSSPAKWVTPEVQIAFTKLSQEGIIEKEMLLLAYRCGKMHHRYWIETLFILNCMDLICCHPVCHRSKCLYVPCLVTQPPPSLPSDGGSSSTVLHFSTGAASFPIALYNQLIVHCVRRCQYAPKLFFGTAHIRLNSNHHLVISKNRTSISIQVQHNHHHNCRPCFESDSTLHPLDDQCGHIRHIIAEHVDPNQSENSSTLIDISTKLRSINEPSLAFQDTSSSFAQICPTVLTFVTYHLQFLTKCWFPGLKLNLCTYVDGRPLVLDQYWKHTVLKSGTVSPSLGVWF